jgi:hypothetical protein
MLLVWLGFLANNNELLGKVDLVAAGRDSSKSA